MASGWVGMDFLTRSRTLGEDFGVGFFNFDGGGRLLLHDALSFGRGGLRGSRGISLALRWRHITCGYQLNALPTVNNEVKRLLTKSAARRDHCNQARPNFEHLGRTRICR